MYLMMGSQLVGGKGRIRWGLDWDQIGEGAEMERRGKNEPSFVVDQISISGGINDVETQFNLVLLNDW